MNHRKVHDQIITRAKSRILDEGTYYEKHHVIPRCMGGLDSLENLVKLTAREHFLVHRLLVEIHRGTKYYFRLVCAWNMMCRIGSGQDLRLVNSRYFSSVKEEFSKSQIRKDFNVDIVIYNELTKSLVYEGNFREYIGNSTGASKQYNKFISMYTDCKGKYKDCTFFLKDYYYSNEKDISTTTRLRNNKNGDNIAKKYPHIDVYLTKNNFTCKVPLKEVGNYTRNYNHAVNNYTFTMKGPKKGITISLTDPNINK